MNVREAYENLRNVADGYVAGYDDMDGDALHSAVVDYTDSVAGKTVIYSSDGHVVAASGHP